MIPARILVVDDDDHVRDALFDELSQTYRVDAVGSGGEALEVLAVQCYDVVISDLKMPDHDGIEVLEFARQHQRDAVRVLLTGYLDERAQRALMTPDAPYKVGKPWHDEIEIVVRRGLEQRDLARKLSASVEDALSLSTFDAELAATRSPLELAEALVRRALTIDGITACGTVVVSEGVEHVFTGAVVPKLGRGWYLDLSLDMTGDLRLQARGIGESPRQIIQYMAHRAQRCCGILEARVSAFKPAQDGGTRINQLMRQATLGAMTSSLLHDLASTMQALSATLGEVSALASGDAAELADAVAEASSIGNEAIQLFSTMRKFIREGDVPSKPMRIEKIVERAVRLAGGYVRERAQLRVDTLPTAEVVVSESLFVHVLVNLLRNAANASPAGGAIDLRVQVNATDVVFSVTDDGPGVSQEIADYMFEPFASATDQGTGLGLAISAYVMQMLGGRISYQKDRTRGACFAVTVPVVSR